MPTTIHRQRIRQVMRYALGVAGNEDDTCDRELGEIHLIKYVYLADLAHAEKHGGVTYTGIPWRFHHFGPWAEEAFCEIQPAMEMLWIRARSFQGEYEDDVRRWRSEEHGVEEALSAELPGAVARAVKSAVHEFSNDTSGLLHHVYLTSPMLRAAPGEMLDFSAAVRQEEAIEQPPQPAPAPKLSKTAQKRRKAAHEALRKRFLEALRKPSSQPMVVTMGGIEWCYHGLDEPRATSSGDEPWLVIPGASGERRSRGRVVLLPHRSEFFHPEQFTAGRWPEQAARLLDLDRRPPPVADGAREIARRVRRLLHA